MAGDDLPLRAEGEGYSILSLVKGALQYIPERASSDRAYPRNTETPAGAASTVQARGFSRPGTAVQRGISPKLLPADAAALFRDLGQLLVFSFTMQRGAPLNLRLDRTSSLQQRGASLCLRLDHPAELHVQRGASLNRTRADRNRIKKHTHYTVVLVLLSIVLGHEFLRKDSTQGNAICERFLGSLRRECLDLVLILGERHLYRAVKDYKEYLNFARPHQGIKQRIACRPKRLDSPQINGKLVSRPVLGGLHHDFYWSAARSVDQETGQPQVCFH
jgi:hypothetical protein